MRLLFVVALLAMAVVVISRPKKDDNEIQDSVDEHSRRLLEDEEEQDKKKKVRGGHQEEDANAYYKDENKKMKEKSKKEEENDLGPIEICSGNKDDEICHCSGDEIWCDAIVYEENGIDVRLKTLDVRIVDIEKIKPVKAYFMNNGITAIKRNRLPEGAEETLQELKLSYNQIKTIDSAAFTRFSKIAKLELDHNRLTTVKAAWFIGDIAESLHQLNLAKNLITEMDDKPFAKLKNLKKLVLDENSINLTKTTFEGLESLEELSMDSCDLSDIEKGILKPLKKLRYLSLRGNRFTEILTVGLSDLPLLEMLDLSDTKLTELHRHSFRDNTKIATIRLENMELLMRIDYCAFCGVNDLTEVVLAHSTKLTTINPNAFGEAEYSDDRIKTLQSLDLSYTGIAELPKDLIDWTSMVNLNLDGLLLNCSCETGMLKGLPIDYLLEHPSPRCKYPESLKDKLVMSLSSEELCTGRVNAHLETKYQLKRAWIKRINPVVLTNLGFIVLGAVLLIVCCVAIVVVIYKKGYRRTLPSSIPVPGQAKPAYFNLNDADHEEKNSWKI